MRAPGADRDARRSPLTRTPLTRTPLARAAALAAVAAAAMPVVALGPVGPLGAAPAARAAELCSSDSVQHVTTAPAALSLLQAESSWERTSGDGVVVAIVDSGVDATNPHLTAAMAGGIDLVGDGQGDNGYADLNGRGTVLAGIVAARKVDGSAVQGLAPAARILSVRVYANDDDQARQAGTAPTSARLAAGIRAAVDAHAQIIDVAWSTGTADADLAAAVGYATQHGSLVVAATGNTDGSLAIDKDSPGGTRYPAADPGAVGVAATDQDGTAASTSVSGADVALAAPGGKVGAVARAGLDCSLDGTDSAWASGYVAAAAALVASAHPDETPAEWAYRLEATAIRADPDARENGIGWGVVQPYDAMSLVPGASVRGPENPFTDSAAGTGPRVADHDIALEHRASAQEESLRIALVTAVVAGTMVAAIAIVALLRRRRRRGSEAAAAVRDDGRALMGAAPTAEESADRESARAGSSQGYP